MGHTARRVRFSLSTLLLASMTLALVVVCVWQSRRIQRLEANEQRMRAQVEKLALQHGARAFADRIARHPELLNLR